MEYLERVPAGLHRAGWQLCAECRTELKIRRATQCAQREYSWLLAALAQSRLEQLGSVQPKRGPIQVLGESQKSEGAGSQAWSRRGLGRL